MEQPDDACKHITECGELGKIGDSCFQVNESTAQILKRMRAYVDPENPYRGDPSIKSVLARLDLIENDLAKIRTCLESLLTRRSKET